MQIGMPQANAPKSLGYTDTVLFLTTCICKPDIYHHESLGKSAADFYLGDRLLTKYLIFFAIYIRLPISGDVHVPHYQQSERVPYPYILQILDTFASGIPICTGNRYVFCINLFGSFKLNNSIRTQYKNFQNISCGSRNNALPPYIYPFKIPKIS